MLLRMQFSLFFFQSLLAVFRLTMSKKTPRNVIEKCSVVLYLEEKKKGKQRQRGKRKLLLTCPWTSQRMQYELCIL